MTDAPNAMAAAEEVFNFIKARLEEQLPFLQFHEAPQNDLSQIAAIFARHRKPREDELLAQLVDAEKALKVAANHVDENYDECPYASGYVDFCSYDGDCEGRRADCWLEYWKKEAGK